MENLKMFNTTEELIQEIKLGKMVILVDDEERENEGDIVCSADHINSQMINFMATEARGLICLALAKKQIEQLNLPLMVRDEDNQTPNKTAFTVSIEAAHGVSTGISAADRAHTIKVAASHYAKPSDVRTPGHIFPIQAKDGGVLKRAGHTEGSVDLAKLAGLAPAAVICEVMNSDGTMARVPELKLFAQKHGLKIGTIVDLIEYRLANESLVEETFSKKLPDDNLHLKIFKSVVDHTEHIVIQKGIISPDKNCLVRVHVENKSRDLISTLLSGNSSLQSARKLISESDCGVLLYMSSPTTHAASQNIENIQTHNHSFHSSILEDSKHFLETTDKSAMSFGPSLDVLDYGIGAQILRHLGIKKMKLLSSKPEKRVGLKAYGIEITEVIPFKI